MRTAIVGAGPTGLYLAIALARRGHQVTVVDRDPGPAADGSWERKGVMQFHHPHAFRPQVVAALKAEMPDVFERLLGYGAVALDLPERPGAQFVLSRRMTVERALRAVAETEPGVDLRIGHADEISADGGRATGVVVDGQRVDADLVLDASGRVGRLGRSLRAPAEGGDCGVAYVSRQYQLHDDAEPGPMNSPIANMAEYPGYLTIVFLHDQGTFSTLIVRASTDDELAGLRHPAAFEAAAKAIPSLAAWTDPARSRPITPVLPGGHLTNTYQGQFDNAGELALEGVVFVGDAVCTTNPANGRGVTTSLLQARALLALIDEHGTDRRAISLEFDAWCRANIRPWFEDHVYTDAHVLRRWAGEDIDFSDRLPSDLIGMATQQAPDMMRVLGPYFAMEGLPATLAAVEPRAREVYETGWRPPVPEGPTRDELASLIVGKLG